MKAIRIILLVLIIIGVIALATQKIWVPILVERILIAEGEPIILQTTQPNVVLSDGRQCYTYDHEATKTEPYAVHEFIDITIEGTTVTGVKQGTQSGPDMTNGYKGTLNGTLENNMITDVFSYTVDGSTNKEKEIYRTNQTGIEKMRYPLIEAKGILIPDTTKPHSILRYPRVGCTASS